MIKSRISCINIIFQDDDNESEEHHHHSHHHNQDGRPQPHHPVGLRPNSNVSKIYDFSQREIQIILLT